MMPLIVLLLEAALLAAMVICTPSWIADANTFLAKFVGVDLLNALGVILAITLASLAQLHLSLNRTEERRGERFLGSTRREIKSTARWLLGLYVFAGALVVVKPLAGSAERVTAAFNALAVLVVSAYIMLLIDIMSAVFSLEPEIDEQDHIGRSAQDE